MPCIITVLFVPLFVYEIFEEVEEGSGVGGRGRGREKMERGGRGTVGKEGGGGKRWCGKRRIGWGGGERDKGG